MLLSFNGGEAQSGSLELFLGQGDSGFEPRFCRWLGFAPRVAGWADELESRGKFASFNLVEAGCGREGPDGQLSRLAILWQVENNGQLVIDGDIQQPVPDGDLQGVFTVQFKRQRFEAGLRVGEISI